MMMGALAQEAFGYGQAQAGGAARDQRAPVLEQARERTVEKLGVRIRSAGQPGVESAGVSAETPCETAHKPP
jgi:hypothetical protein